ncbi:MAG: hypothetical protein KJZ58_08910 [Flavobacteriales bacterium]|nr:hypothetical protein [Flavobacteriales bacterium]
MMPSTTGHRPDRQLRPNAHTKLDRTGSFEVLGRFDHSDLRGCNLLVG